MALLDEIVSVPRRTSTIFFMVNASASMNGNKIGAVNDAMANCLLSLENISQTNPDAEIKVAVLVFSNKPKWMYNRPLSPSDFIWKDLRISGCSNLGAAFLELNKKLSRKGGFMQEPNASFAPIIILLTDSKPADDYNEGLWLLKANSWFNVANKAAIAIGDDVDKAVLKDFTGSDETVITAHNIEAMTQIMHLVAVTSSQIGHNSQNQSTTYSEIIGSPLKNALIKALSRFGETILYESRLVSVLDDYHAFAEKPVLKSILRQLCIHDYLKKIISNSDSKTHRVQIANQISNKFGYKPSLICELTEAFYEVYVAKPANKSTITNVNSKNSQSKKENVAGKPIKAQPRDVHSLYDDIGFHSEGLIQVRKGNKYGYIDSKSNLVVVPIIYDLLYPFINGTAIAKQNDKYGIIGKDGRCILPFIYSSLNELANREIKSRGGEKKKVGFYSEGLIMERRNGKCGFVDSKNCMHIVIPFKYDELYPFVNGIAIAKLNGKYGMIGKDGRCVLPFIYESYEEIRHRK